MNYTVAEILGSNEWDGGDNPARATTYWAFRQDGDSQEYEIGRRPDNPLKVGDSFEAEVTGEKYGKIKLKKLAPQQQGRNGSKRDEPYKPDPSRQRSIARQHAQKVALAYAQVKAEKGDLPEPFKVDDLRPIIDWLYEDVMRVTLHEDNVARQLDEALQRSEANA